MNEEQLRTTVLNELHKVAPDIDPEEIDPDTDLREQADIDSMDFLNLAIGIGKSLGVEIPEADYARLETVNEYVAYLKERTDGRGGAGPA